MFSVGKDTISAKYETYHFGIIVILYAKQEFIAVLTEKQNVYKFPNTLMNIFKIFF